MASHERGTDFSIQEHYGNYRGSQVNIRLYLVFSDISPSTHRILDVFDTHGKPLARRIQRRTLREVWSRTRRGRRIIPELLHPDIFTDICAFLMGNPRSNRSTLNVGSPSSVPIRFQRYLGWFWGRKASLVRGESRGSCFVFLFKLVWLNIASQRLWMCT